MTTTKTPETDLIAQLNSVREALTAERESLLARVAVIDEALGTAASVAPQKAAKAPRTGTLKAGVLAALERKPGSTIKDLALACAEDSTKPVESTLQGLVSSGQVTRDNSSPRKFSLATPATTPTTTPKPNGKSNGAAATA